NSTTQINFTIDNADYYIEWKDLPQGDVSLSVANKDYDSISIKVNDSMLVVDVNFYDTKPPIINVSEDFAYGLFSYRPLENVSIVATDGVSDTVWCEVNDVEFTNSYVYSFYADDLVSIEITCNDGGNEASVSKTYDFVYYDINICDERTKEPFDFSSIDNMDMIVTFSDDTTKSYSISNSTVYIVENQSDYAEPVYVTALVKYGNPPTTYLRKYYTTGGLIDMYLLNPNSGTICFMTGYIGQGVDYNDVVELKYLGTTVAQNKFDVEGKVIFYIYEGSEYDVCIDKGLYTSCIGKVDAICNSIFFINLPLEFSTLIHAPRIPVVDIFDENGLLVVTFEDPLGRNNAKNIVITDQDGNVVLNSSFTDAIYQYSFNATALNITSILVSVTSDDGKINILRSYAYPHKLNMPSFQGWGKLLFLLMMVIVPAGLILAEAFSLLRQGMSLILSGIYLLVNAAVWAEYTNLMVGFGVLLLGIGLALTLKKK
ncbi:hypothetical protein J7M00_03895, partial [bacterium]|nr:hypothetical protein [bacterium]